MNKYLQQILIISSVFLIILWFQKQDDRKYHKKRKNLYDIYKFPVLMSAIIGLLLNLFCNNTDIDVFIQPTQMDDPSMEINKSNCGNKYSLFDVDTGKFD